MNQRWIPGSRAEALARVLLEFEQDSTIGGLALPDAKVLEQSDWYAAVAQMMLEAVDGPLCSMCRDHRVLSEGLICRGCM